MKRHALEYAAAGWEVFPLNGKIPAISKHDGGNGVLDATSDPARVEEWWSRFPKANIGGRVPKSYFVIDTDPRNGMTHEVFADWLMEHGDWPRTFTVTSGRRDGGCHFYFIHRGERLSAKHLPKGMDLKTHSGYCLLPPSIHPDTGLPYTANETSVARPPLWLSQLLRPEAVQVAPQRQKFSGESDIAVFNEMTTWRSILLPHKWRETRGGWLHPQATSSISATVRGNRLYVYSPNTPFEMTTPGDPHGYSKFDAYALLNHAGDISATLEHFRATGEVPR